MCKSRRQLVDYEPRAKRQGSKKGFNRSEIAAAENIVLEVSTRRSC
jgi:hypothetical protein